MCRSKSLAAQKHHVDRVKAKSADIIDRRKLGEEGHKEMEMLINSQQYTKHEKRAQTIRDEIIQKAKSTYDMPATVIWNQIDLKLALEDLSKLFGIHGDMELDNGNSYSYQIIV